MISIHIGIFLGMLDFMFFLGICCGILSQGGRD